MCKQCARSSALWSGIRAWCLGADLRALWTGGLWMTQAGFGQIDVALDAAQDLVIDNPLVAKLKNGFAFDLESFVGKPFVIGRKELRRGVGIVRFADFQLTDTVFVFDAQPLDGFGISR